MNPPDRANSPVASPVDTPGAPPRPDAPFDAPWQARAFALTVAAHEAGLFDWRDWSAALGRALEGAAPDGSDYYARWLLALETLLDDRRAGGADHPGRAPGAGAERRP